MKSTTVRGTPVNHIGASTGSIAPGQPKGADSQTTMQQFRGTGMSTTQSPRGTPYNSQAGNPPGFSRTASSGRYGVSPGAGGVDMNDPAQNGSGVVFDGATRANGFTPHHEPTMDSPVPASAPIFDPGFVPIEGKARLGSGNEGAARDGLVAGGGVMSRGLVGTSKKTDTDEGALTKDDTLPTVPPAGKAVRTNPSNYVTTSKYPKK